MISYTIYIAASFESQCAVEGSVVDYHCYNEDSWAINWQGGINHNSITFITSNETGRDDDMYITTDHDYIDRYGSVSLIQCLQQETYYSFFALLIVKGIIAMHERSLIMN